MKDNITNKKIGAWLAQEREKRGFSQQYVADILGVTKTAVHYWETGKRTIYAINFIDYCKAIGANPTDCIEEITK